LYKKTMLQLLKKYGIWLALLGIPLWNIFNMIFAPMGIEEEESVATGTVILFYLGLYIGHSVARMYFKDSLEVSSTTTLRGTAALVTVTLIFIGLVRYSRYSPHAASNAFLIIFCSFLLAILLGLAGTAFRLVSRNKLQASESMALASKSEMQLLQSQLSPHFLFNTLNNLYGLSLEKNEKLPELLLKLSDLLRYSVYQKGNAFVPLKEEISYIRNYIEFEKIRLDDRLDLTLHLDEPGELEIAPMLLIVFVENAFKHSKNTTDAQVVMEVNLRVWEGNILFSVYNTYDGASRPNLLNKESGLGLENAKRRLALLYPGRYEYNVEDTGHTYKVLLQLKKT